MAAGAIAFFVYAYCVCVVMMKYKPSAMLCSLAMIPIWCATAFGLWMLWLKCGHDESSRGLLRFAPTEMVRIRDSFSIWRNNYGDYRVDREEIWAAGGRTLFSISRNFSSDGDAA